APTAVGNTQTTANNANATAANQTPTAGSEATATGNSGGFQVQELLIKFSGINAQGTTQQSGNTNGGAQSAVGNAGGNFQVSAFNLQIEEVNLTLVNGSGQTAQIQAPLQTSNANGQGTNQAVANAKAQAAKA
ncbi:MAG: hypothetical protein WBR10_14620, partial [Candidatus Acidiferrum sp.]